MSVPAVNPYDVVNVFEQSIYVDGVRKLMSGVDGCYWRNEEGRAGFRNVYPWKS